MNGGHRDEHRYPLAWADGWAAARGELVAAVDRADEDHRQHAALGDDAQRGPPRRGPTPQRADGAEQLGQRHRQHHQHGQAADHVL